MRYICGMARILKPTINMTMGIPYEILVKYCRNRASAEEVKEAEEWLSQGDNLSVYLNLKEEWRYIDDDKILIPDRLLVWQKIKVGAGLSANKQRTRLNFYRAVAACLLLAVVGLSTLYFLGDKRGQNQTAELFSTISTGSREKSKMELPDGSKVWLNANSKAVLSNKFSNNIREVTVDGELFFDVNPSDKKFVVNAGIVKVEVLGTSFVVNTHADSNHIQITLKTGRVAVFDAAGNKQLFVMDSAHRAVVSKKDLSYNIQHVETAWCNIWTGESLTIHNEPLYRIVNKLESWYNLNITYTGLDSSKTYSFHVQNENIFEFLELFSAVTPISYSLNGRQLYIEAKE